MFSALLAAGADVDARDAQGWTPTDLAKVHGYAETITLLEATGRRTD